jgi:serine phosphatase RsbU (regulator of sigma subunit)
MPRLTITAGPLAGQQFSFTDSVIIGRGAYSDIRIDDATVSRRHAEVHCGEDGIWRIHDLGSANGLLHNGKAVRGELLIDGTVKLVVGEVEVELSTEELQAPAETGRRDFPQLLDRLELLAWVTSLPARREDPPLLIGQILDAILRAFEGCTEVGLFVTRPGSATLIPYAWRRRHGDDENEPPPASALAQACLRHVDGVAGGRGALDPLDIAEAPVGVLAAPLVLAGETLGVIAAESEREDTWTPLDRALAKAIAGVLGGLLEAERSSQPQRKVAERDLLLARRVQQQFLPQLPLRLPGYKLAEAYVPARVVGGDHYDYLRFADDRVGMIIADVSGKAVSAALVMARFGMAVRLLASQASTPLDLLVTLNILLLDELEPGMFVTAQVIAIHGESGDLEIANAGHPAPLLLDAGGDVRELKLDPGAALGANAQTRFGALQMHLEPGACLLLYTDGLNEAENEEGEQFGLKPVTTAMAASANAVEALAAVNRELADFVGSTPAVDDLTVLVLSRDR